MRATVTEKFFSKIIRPGYRRAYVANEARMAVAHQIKALRDQRGWSQKDLAAKMETSQSVISRLENPDYGRVSLATLIEVAAVFDVGFVGRYCSFPEMVFRSKDVSPDALQVASFASDQFCLHTPISPQIQSVGAFASATSKSTPIIRLGSAQVAEAGRV